MKRIHRVSFTEDQMDVMESVTRDNYQRGVVFGVVIGMGISVGITISFLIAQKYELLFF